MLSEHGAAVKIAAIGIIVTIFIFLVNFTYNYGKDTCQDQLSAYNEIKRANLPSIVTDLREENNVIAGYIPKISNVNMELTNSIRVFDENKRLHADISNLNSKIKELDNITREKEKKIEDLISEKTKEEGKKIDCSRR